MRVSPYSHYTMPEWNYLTSELPGDSASLKSSVKYVLSRALLDLQCCLPAQIVSYDRKANTATVQPLIKYTAMDGSLSNRPQLTGIPILSLGAGGFHINFPVKPGDLLWIVASDRDISAYMQALDAQPGPTARNHSFSDCWGIPDVMRKYTINAADSEAMVIQSTDAATRIAIFSDHIIITAPSNVKVDTPLTTFTGDVHILGKTTIEKVTKINDNTTVTGNVVIAGGFAQSGGSGPATFGGSVKATGEVTGNGVTMSGHKHTSSNPGTDTSTGHG